MDFFTIADANQALPDVKKKFENVINKKDEVAQAEQQLQMSIATSNSLEDYITLKQKLNHALTEFYKAVEILESFGVSAKNLEQGLIDFPSKRFDEDVWLCWKYGESEIKFWHEKDSGFMGRKPIEVNSESLI